MNLFLALFGGSLVVFFVVVPLLGRRQAARDAEALQQLGAQASAVGLRHLGVNAATGELLFSGESDGVAWTAQVSAPRPGSAARSRQGNPSTRVLFPSLATKPGTFFLAMALPPGVTLPPPRATTNDGGMLASLADRAVEGVLDLYVATYFGAEHRALVNVAGAARPQGPAEFMLLSTDPALAARLLDPEGLALLSSLRTAELHGIALINGGVGVLVTPSGLSLGCGTGLFEPAKLKFVADRAARLVAHAKAR
jgi:hypothetical protein